MPYLCSNERLVNLSKLWHIDGSFTFSFSVAAFNFKHVGLEEWVILIAIPYAIKMGINVFITWFSSSYLFDVLISRYSIDCWE